MSGGDDDPTDLAFKTYQLTEEQGSRLTRLVADPGPLPNGGRLMTAPATVLEHDPDSGCVGCPFYSDSDRNGEWCAAPSTDELENGMLPAPDTCDLRRGPVEVRRG